MTRARSSAGFVTIEQIAVAAFGLVLFTWAANIILFQYARAATRLAIDEGVRSAAVVSEEQAADRCTATAAEAMSNLLGGPLGDDIAVSCTAVGGIIRATATGSVNSWVPTIEKFAFTSEAAAPLAERP